MLWRYLHVEISNGVAGTLKPLNNWALTDKERAPVLHYQRATEHLKSGNHFFEMKNFWKPPWEYHWSYLLLPNLILFHPMSRVHIWYNFRKGILQTSYTRAVSHSSIIIWIFQWNSLKSLMNAFPWYGVSLNDMDPFVLLFIFMDMILNDDIIMLIMTLQAFGLQFWIGWLEWVCLTFRGIRM